MRRSIVGLLAAALLCAWSVASANIIYSVNLTDGTETVSGSITTDGNVGAITAADIVAWSLTASGVVDASIASTMPGAAAPRCLLNGCALVATATALSLDLLTFKQGLVFFVSLGFKHNESIDFNNGRCRCAGQYLHAFFNSVIFLPIHQRNTIDRHSLGPRTRYARAARSWTIWSSGGAASVALTPTHAPEPASAGFLFYGVGYVKSNIAPISVKQGAKRELNRE